MGDDPFLRDHAPPIGQAEPLGPGLRVVTAPNAGPMTFTGTRSYILGEGKVAVIDPGPPDPRHLAALADAVAGEAVIAILVTHAHRDHSSGARALGARLSAPVLAHGDPRGARSPVMAQLADRFDLGGGEGIDADFRPDERIGEGDVLHGPDWALRAIHTPGHLGDHLAFQWKDAVFSGDVAMGWATTLISPPDGDLAAFRRSIARLRDLRPGRLFPGHGGPVEAPARLLAHLLAHREAREAQILHALDGRPASVAALVRQLYADVDPALHGAAARNVLAHLIDLSERGQVAAQGILGPDATFARTSARAADGP